MADEPTAASEPPPKRPRAHKEAPTITAAYEILCVLDKSGLSPVYYPFILRTAEQFLAMRQIAEAENKELYGDF